LLRGHSCVSTSHLTIGSIKDFEKAVDKKGDFVKCNELFNEEDLYKIAGLPDRITDH
jgi:hypothetical protein